MAVTLFPMVTAVSLEQLEKAESPIAVSAGNSAFLSPDKPEKEWLPNLSIFAPLISFRFSK